MEDNLVNIRAYPQVEGRPLLQLPALDGRRNGVDPITVALQSLFTWGVQLVSIAIGVNPMRTGANPPERESGKTEMNTIEFSINATSYIYRMQQNVKEKTATTILNLTQEIIRYKDSIPYKWLLTVMGNETFNGLFLLDQYAGHRMGLYVRDYNANAEKNRINQAGDMALGKGELEFDQWFAVTQVEDYKMAAKMLALYKRKKEKRERKEKLQELKIQQQLQQEKFQQEMALIKEKNDGAYRVAEKETEGYKYAADAQAQSRIKVKEITVESEPEKQSQKAEASKEINSSKEKDKEQAPFARV
jgi:hypothetical protein